MLGAHDGTHRMEGTHGKISWWDWLRTLTDAQQRSRRRTYRPPRWQWIHDQPPGALGMCPAGGPWGAEDTSRRMEGGKEQGRGANAGHSRIMGGPQSSLGGETEGGKERDGAAPMVIRGV